MFKKATVNSGSGSFNDSGEANNKIYVIGNTSGERPLWDFSFMEEGSEKNSLEKIVIRNTLILGDIGKYKAEVEKVMNNSWQKGLKVNRNDFRSMDASQLSAARQTDGSLPEIEFMQLKRRSDLIDAGVDVGLPYEGKAPDL